jgi:hypothetical protein
MLAHQKPILRPRYKRGQIEPVFAGAYEGAHVWMIDRSVDTINVVAFL